MINLFHEKLNIFSKSEKCYVTYEKNFISVLTFGKFNQ